MGHSCYQDEEGLVYDVLSDMMSMFPEGFMGDSANIDYPFRKQQNIGLLRCKHPYFVSKKSDVLLLPDHRLALPSTKKVFENLLHFLHHGIGCPVFTDDFW